MDLNHGHAAIGSGGISFCNCRVTEAQAGTRAVGIYRCVQLVFFSLLTMFPFFFHLFAFCVLLFFNFSYGQLSHFDAARSSPVKKKYVGIS